MVTRRTLADLLLASPPRSPPRTASTTPTALLNKSTLAMDNNVFVSRTNIVFSQNDRVGMMKKVETVVASANAAGAKDMSTGDLSKNVLEVVSGSDGTDTAMMSKASAVVAATGTCTAWVSASAASSTAKVV
ncbi:hypothetical protein Gpo141_00000955 [Globisporangium polare]